MLTVGNDVGWRAHTDALPQSRAARKLFALNAAQKSISDSDGSRRRISEEQAAMPRVLGDNIRTPAQQDLHPNWNNLLRLYVIAPSAATATIWEPAGVRVVWSKIVQRYTLFTLRGGQVTGHHPVMADCDVAAMEAAWQLADERYCELWSGERLVAFIERNIATGM